MNTTSGAGEVYERTEDGSITHVSIREGLDEINHAQMTGKRDVKTMSSITRTDFAIEYKDGRKVRLVRVDAPAPEGYAQGQAVVVRRPGQAPVMGTVAHIHTAPGYVAVMDDRHRAVSSYPARFVSAVETAEEARAERTALIQRHADGNHSRGRVITVRGKDYVVTPVVPAESQSTKHAPKGWVPKAYVTYWSVRNGERFGSTRTAGPDDKPGTVGCAVWDAVNAPSV
ncbi:hypothetical protein [Streptomyces caniscabiei]|uniref:hypothetical protein n=1 Tax=Streptomyces caniscabiei TaxID=2746961 RepID=UPI001872C173|nr:hypothetical protein [Streptomyces caniscabiei]MBE4796138.1 hypothetical protein [Streptomyces caniscabiei]MDX2944443.1 hypothetical protein [Streptomyces caniscabiei]